MIKTVSTMITLHPEIPMKDRKLTFHQKVYPKAGQILSALPRLSSYLDTNKRRIIYTSMLKSQLNYCTLVWMLFQRSSISLINKIQERTLRMTYYGKLINFKTILSKYNEITIHQRNLQVLM